MKRNTDIAAISNELEFCLKGNVQAPQVIRAAEAAGLQVDPEVNRCNIMELLVSMAANTDVLNSTAHAFIHQLAQITRQLGGRLYGGSSLIKPVGHLEPAWYRTTSLSRTLAENLLDITSQQVVIGIARTPNGEAFGMQLYNTLNAISPVLVATFASSPFTSDGNTGITDTGFHSRRIPQYQQATHKLGRDMLVGPTLSNMSEHTRALQQVSDSVNQKLAQGKLDANETELYRQRQGGAYAPFAQLAPHQVYWMVRPRPDHANSDSRFSLELRVGDLPLRVQTMQAFNSLVTGLAYYASAHGFEQLNKITSALTSGQTDSYQRLIQASQQGMETAFARKPIGYYLKELAKLATQGLRHRNMDAVAMNTELERIISQGNDAQHLRAVVKEQRITTSAGLEHYLATLLQTSLEKGTR